MTVGELIVLLQHHDLRAPVYYEDAEYGPCDVQDITLGAPEEVVVSREPVEPQGFRVKRETIQAVLIT